ncbi:hypothetical protein [Geodermatophilus sabuli]|uniref:Uncharacterized protein n=1 Tax=Geodermatophilus sabuli TaxID=1564158 RepID=A0A285EHK3_9ACTN|nr:hypothetical protein [Geodermatophilus sabuli]MBB3086003.1 hypothetical protein [Geodermatophilus sabuli]SNX98343.1 hypothetical protein SAMN06893097_110125 [Geodermatophilus sabuli]
MPDAADFRALARSSPWRWSTLRFTVRWRGERALGPVRAWLRRPDVVRVETLDGHLLQVVRESPQRVGVLTSGGGYDRRLPWPEDVPAPLLRPDGLVAERPDGLSYDAPMYQDYAWVAVLDPVELADGRDPETGERAGPGLTIETVTEIEHGGRPAWEAVVRPTPLYEPRCGCCSLVRSRLVDRYEWGEASFADAEYPTEYLVRLDVQTGVCVWTEALDGTWVGTGHVLRIEAVDEPMDDALFP